MAKSCCEVVQVGRWSKIVARRHSSQKHKLSCASTQTKFTSNRNKPSYTTKSQQFIHSSTQSGYTKIHQTHNNQTKLSHTDQTTRPTKPNPNQPDNQTIPNLSGQTHGPNQPYHTKPHNLTRPNKAKSFN